MGSISYRRLWHILLDRDIKKTQLKNAAGLSSSTMAKISQGESVTLRTISAICEVLRCQPGDILDYVPDPWPEDSDPEKKEKV